MFTAVPFRGERTYVDPMNLNSRPDVRAGERIRKQRLALGRSQREIASVRVGHAYVSRIEAGQRRPSWTALVEIAERLGTTALKLGLGDAKVCPVCKSRIHG
jgi:transcriptional regulator with XRE-family HTH domain